MFVGLLSGACADEGAERVGQAPQGLCNGVTDPEEGGAGRAAVHVTVVGRLCGVTLIAPDWVVTAGHCVGGFPGVEPSVLVPGLTGEPGITVAPNACYLHPRAVPARPGIGCGELLPGEADAIDTADDLALLHLSRPVRELGDAAVHRAAA